MQSKDSNKSLFDAGWKVEELKRLVDTCQELIAAVSGVFQLVDNPTTDMIQANVAGRLAWEVSVNLCPPSLVICLDINGLLHRMFLSA